MLTKISKKSFLASQCIPVSRLFPVSITNYHYQQSEAMTSAPAKKNNEAPEESTHKPDEHDDDLEDSISIGSASTAASRNSVSAYQDKESIEIAKKESKQIFYTRAIVLTVLVCVATAVSLSVYLVSTSHEEEVFVEHFEEEAMKLQSEFQASASRCIEALESVSNQITAYAIASNSEWPNVAVPQFERRTKYAMEVSNVQSIVFYPIVSQDARASWESFSVANQGWLEEGLAIQKVPVEDWDQKNIDILESIWGTTPDNRIPTEIFRFDNNSTSPETGSGPYAPWWQFAPAFPVPSIVNHNGMSHPNKDHAIQSVISSKEPVLTRAWDYSNYDDPDVVDKRAVLDLFIEHAVGGHKDYSNYAHGPASNLYVPVFESYEDDAAVVGVLSSYLDWQDFFEDVLLVDDVGVIVVLENSCGQQFTYRLDGYSARYLGIGDLHDTHYDNMKIVIDLGKFVEFEGDKTDYPEGQCLYHASVYPSADNEAQIITNGPEIFAIVLACTFLFTCSVFLLYDYLVERRQRLVLTTAVRSETMVASLFPKGIRDRLYKEGKDAEIAKNNRSKNAFVASEVPTSNSRLEDGCKAIADSYPNCTVCFMDVVGFTQWSSGREPWQVFKLLETMYKTFDKIAKRLEVFKVETIGDCYVAVTGIPHAQPDHAVLMAKFATECVLRVGRILSRLVDSLGKETDTLRLRVGMHSGPVTAGVLRGAKARFQLFGDTVNTAARMESTGAPSKIQLSSETAALIQAAGKPNWIRKRDEEVMAKGKGNLQTYWLQANEVDCSRAGSCINSSSHQS